MLTPGTKLGPYEIVAAIGAGAMGEVYRARDQRLQRDVAIKILPPAFASDPERLQRFEQEARAAGQLHHPNILTIFDVGAQDGVPYEVSELLEGSTLRAELSGGALPMRRALDLGTQIAQGLAAAHEHGIVHRDLKPENLFVTKDGRVKILDFGLAKFTRPEGAAALREYDSLAGTMTATGVILGTAGYMAPEQVRGDAVDARTDLFAFGAILYEMVTGRRAFRGESPIDTLHAILRADPPALAESRTDLPPGLERVILHCLEKRPEQRFHSARDVAFALESLSAPTMVGTASGVAMQDKRSRQRVGALVAALMAALVAAVGGGLVGRSDHRVTPDVRFNLPAPEGTTLANDGANQAISPDGRLLAIVALDSAGVSHLWVRPLGSLDARPLEGTEGAFLPFWSPDSRTLAFFTYGKLQRLALTGGRPQLICAAPAGRGGTWNKDGVIVFAAGSSGPLFRVAATGGELTAVTQIDTSRHETGHRSPCFLPDGRHFVFVSLPQHEGAFDVFVGELGSNRVSKIGASAAGPIYARPGYLILARQQDLVAQAFDTRGLRLHGDAHVLGDAAGVAQFDGEAFASVSNNGVLVYGTTNVGNSRLQWFDRDGRSTGVVGLPAGRYEGVSLSPDGRTAVIEHRNSAKSVDLWSADLVRGFSSRFSLGGGENAVSVFSPDGARVAYFSNRDGPQDLYVKDLSGGGDEVRVYHSPAQFKLPFDWTRDGKSLFFGLLDPQTQWDIYLVPIDGSAKPTPVLRGPLNEIPVALSPGGDRLAYFSDESGRVELYVRSFPESGHRYQVSTAGGNPQPYGIGIMWVRSTGELLYGAADGVTVMSARARSPGSLEMTDPVTVCRLPAGVYGVTVTSDGKRFLATVPAPGGQPPGINVILDWTALLGR